MNFERNRQQDMQQLVPLSNQYNYGQPPGLQLSGPVEQSPYDKDQKLKKSISNLAFTFAIFSVICGFIGAYFYDRLKSIKKQMGNRPFLKPMNFTRTDPPADDHEVDERFEILDRHRQFRDKSMKSMGENQARFRGSDENQDGN